MSDSPSPTQPGPNVDAAHPILTHERSLANKIAKGSEAGDILDQQLAMLGIQLVTQLNVLIKTSRIHGRTNAAVDKPVDSMLTLVKTLAADHPVVLRLQNDFLFLGDSHLKMNSQQMAVFSSIIEALNKWRIGGLSFASGAESKDLREFAYLFVSLDPEKHTLDDLQEALRTEGVKKNRACSISDTSIRARRRMAPMAQARRPRPAAQKILRTTPRHWPKADMPGRLQQWVIWPKIPGPAARSASNKPNARFKTSSS